MVSSVTPRVEPSRLWSTNSDSTGTESSGGVESSIVGASVAGAASVVATASVSGGACVSGAAVSPGGSVAVSSELPDVQPTKTAAARPAAINFFTGVPLSMRSLPGDRSCNVRTSRYALIALTGVDANKV